MLMELLRSGLSLLLSACFHGLLVLAIWLATWIGPLLLPDEPLDMDGGASATMLDAMAAAATLPPLDPDGIVDVRITLIDPATDPALAPALPLTQVEQTAAKNPDPDPENKPDKPGTSATTVKPASTDAKSTNDGDPTQLRESAKTGEGTGTGTGEGDAKQKSGKPPCEAVDGVEVIDATAWKVKRSLIEYYAGDLKAFDRLGWVEPYYSSDGKAAGLKIGLARCSAVKAGGLKHNDVIQSINGVPVTSFSQALSAWLKLRDSTRLKVLILRKGAPITLTYQIVR